MIEAYQQPAAHLLIYRVVTVAYSRLRRLRDQRLGIAKQQAHQRSRAIEFLFDDFRL
jgi:hypothetical protein